MTSTHFPRPATFSYTPRTCVRTRSILTRPKGTVTRFCAILISVLANVFSRLAFGEKILFHRPWNARGSHNISIQELFGPFWKFQTPYFVFLCKHYGYYYNESVLWWSAIKNCFQTLLRWATMFMVRSAHRANRPHGIAYFIIVCF